MSAVESRFLGPIDLDGGEGGGAMEGSVPFGGGELPVRLEIDHPARLGQSLIDDVDVVLDHLDIPDKISREAIAERLHNPQSAPAQLLAAWNRAGSGTEHSAGELLEELRPVKMVITPDGGTANLDRVVLTYALADPSVKGRITVRLPNVPTGPEVDPAPRSGY